MGVMMGEFVTLLEDIRKTHNLNKAYIMVQDVAHARGGGEAMQKALSAKGWSVIDMKVYPTGTVDYSVGLMTRARRAPSSFRMDGYA